MRAKRRMKKLTHFGKGAEVAMVDVTAKAVTSRAATAHGFVRIGRAALAQVRRRKTPKGDPLEIARIAGIAAAKRTSEWIPLCHPLPLTHIDVTATAMQEWRGDHLARHGHGADRRGDGSAGGRFGRGAHRLRHVQGPR